jgi:o-succinylbenzoate---CoA ligase
LELIENIEKYKITHVSLVATQLIRLLENKASINILKNLKSILIGGSHIPSNLIKNSIKYNLPIYTTYGSTEMASQITTTKSNVKSEKLYTAGKLLNYRSIKISEDGEILVKGETLFKGYIENNIIHNPLDSEGWFHTGDLGKIDNEGYLTVIGRKDNMFISGGENIYPEEIEKVLTTINEIENALVIDIPNNEFGARPIAFIKFHSNKNPDKKNIKIRLRKHLPKYKIPDAFYIWPKDISYLKPNRSDFKTIYTNSKPEEIV